MTEESDATSASASEVKNRYESASHVQKNNQKPASLPAQDTVRSRHDDSRHAASRLEASRHGHRETMPSSDYASLSDIQHPEDFNLPEKKVSGNLVSKF